jgi:hypothetical protein
MVVRGHGPSGHDQGFRIGCSFSFVNNLSQHSLTQHPSADPLNRSGRGHWYQRHGPLPWPWWPTDSGNHWISLIIQLSAVSAWRVSLQSPSHATFRAENNPATWQRTWPSDAEPEKGWLVMPHALGFVARDRDSESVCHSSRGRHPCRCQWDCGRHGDLLVPRVQALKLFALPCKKCSANLKVCVNPFKKRTCKTTVEQHSAALIKSADILRKGWAWAHHHCTVTVTVTVHSLRQSWALHSLGW